MLRWGLVPSWAPDPSIGNRLANARSETVAEKPSFRHAFKCQRCLLVADGFYEWQQTDDRKQPYYVRMKDGAPFGMAGLWERWGKGAAGLGLDHEPPNNVYNRTTRGCVVVVVVVVFVVLVAVVAGVAMPAALTMERDEGRPSHETPLPSRLELFSWGVKPTSLRRRGHEAIEPALDQADSELATAQAAVDASQPDVVVGRAVVEPWR